MSLEVRLSTIDDLEEIERIYRYARHFMFEHRNWLQWWLFYPEREMIVEDIARHQSYVAIENERIVGTFVLIVGYEREYDQFRHDNEPYITIRRIASDGTAKGLIGSAFAVCESIGKDVMADTSQYNTIMHKALLKNGFTVIGSFDADYWPNVKHYVYEKRIEGS